ncbi:hypothetical protein HHK36_021265 [Tetracentron sinense]|uniref:ABC transporter C family member 13 n=1 Tax=Tetracentron sinense TaxID=13715 RepID=A0A834YPH9_TETSI|nr:hypothetical protein HHK36_021265 [Tetracentron sinense]
MGCWQANWGLMLTMVGYGVLENRRANGGPKGLDQNGSALDDLPPMPTITKTRNLVTWRNKKLLQGSMLKQSTREWFMELVLNDCIGFAGPLLLNKLIWFLEQGQYLLEWTDEEGWLDNWSGRSFEEYWSRHLSLVSEPNTISRGRLRKRSGELPYPRVRAAKDFGCGSVVCLCISLAERSKFSEGEIQTYMSIDADRTVNLCNSFHDMWSNSYILSTYSNPVTVPSLNVKKEIKLGLLANPRATIVPPPKHSNHALGVCLRLCVAFSACKSSLSDPEAKVQEVKPIVNKWISKLIASATEKMMKQKDERIRRTGELLMYIRTLKMYGWELLFTNQLMETRSLEVKYLSVFTCLALFNTLISPLNSFPWVINGLIDAIISTRRLSRFLSSSEHKSEMVKIADPSSPSLSKDQADSTFEHMAVAIRDACFVWSNSSEEGQNSVLNHVTLELPKGLFIAVIGEVGSGKSSLLNSILGEMRLIHGSIHSHGSIAYVSQVPWILSGTIRDNILFGKGYDVKRYAEVLQACALDVDISLMVGGDLAYIGEKGTNLSGGQRARLALARAVYHGSDILMLDDVFSAVDAQVARCILYNAILGPLMDQRTRLLCTHNIQAISSADMIVVMDKGLVKWVGSLADFSVSSYSTVSLLKEPIISSSQLLRHESSTNSSSDSKQNLLLQRDCTDVSEEAQEIIEIELRKEGTVEFSVYKNYATFSSWLVTAIICLSAILMQVSRNGNDLWLSHWVDSTSGSNKTKYSISFYLVILCIFCVVNSLLTLVRAFSFAFGGLRAAIQVHNKLLNKLVNAPVHFFDQTPSGRILNRLSSDLYTIDDSLPFILNILLANFIGLLGIAIVLSYVQVLFLLLLLPFWYIYSKLQNIVEFLILLLGESADKEMSSFPIHVPFHFFDSSDRMGGVEGDKGGSSDRQEECGIPIEKENELQVYARRKKDTNEDPHEPYQEASSDPDWASSVSDRRSTLGSTSRELRRLDSVSRSPIYASFTETLDGSSTIRAFKAEMVYVASEKIMPPSNAVHGQEFFLARFTENVALYQQTSYSEITASLWLSLRLQVGLALSYAAPIVSLLSSFLSSFTETEKEMVSVERVLQYMDVPQEELHGSQSLHPDWPFQGQIEFQNVSLRYMPSLPAALHDITFTISGGTQVGIVGRTGAGKSSVINSLFRLTPICGGYILVDGINVAEVSVRDLRSHFAVVPQSPFLFEGPLRDNLDPYRVTSDSQIWQALQKCHVKEEVEEAGGLDIHVKESGTSFSVGQRQLLCLARALLKSSKVLCLDECTANVDTRTAMILQNTISNECRGITVITIAHRISTVLNMDNILILDQGILVEQGSPQMLLQDECSRFSSFAKASSM